MRAVACLLVTLFVSTAAHADYSLVCGKVRDKGAEKSDIALVVDPDSLDTKIFLAGKELPKDSFHAKGGSGGRWDVSIFNAKGDVKSVYELLEKPAQAQQYKATGEKRVKLGAAKKCLLTDTTPKPAPADAAPKTN